jgi:hypothetical protein
VDKRFLGAAPRAFEGQQGPISPIFKPAENVSDEYFSLEKSAAQLHPLLKAGQGQFSQF